MYTIAECIAEERGYTITAHFVFGSYAWVQCRTLAECIAYLTEWLPMATHIECQETIPSCHRAGLMPDELCDICGGYAESEA
jgi:hypothetical protein